MGIFKKSKITDPNPEKTAALRNLHHDIDSRIRMIDRYLKGGVTAEEYHVSSVRDDLNRLVEAITKLRHINGVAIIRCYDLDCRDCVYSTRTATEDEREQYRTAHLDQHPDHEIRLSKMEL